MRGGQGDYNYNESSTALQQSCTRGEGNCFFPVNEEEEQEEDKEVEEGKDEEEEEEITTTLQCCTAMQHSFTRG